jgi:hypothetical protein
LKHYNHQAPFNQSPHPYQNSSFDHGYASSFNQHQNVSAFPQNVIGSRRVDQTMNKEYKIDNSCVGRDGLIETFNKRVELSRLNG